MVSAPKRASWKSYVQANNHASSVIQFQRLRKSVSARKIAQSSATFNATGDCR